MDGVILRSVTVENWKECIELQVHHDQKDFVPSNLYSIAEAQFYPRAVSLAIYNDQGQMVGFTMYGVDETSGKWKIFRIMIDQAHQGKGSGRAAMEAVIEQLAGRPDCDEILIAYKPTNEAARELYAHFGFAEQGVRDGLARARLDLEKGQDGS